MMRNQPHDDYYIGQNYQNNKNMNNMNNINNLNNMNNMNNPRQLSSLNNNNSRLSCHNNSAHKSNRQSKLIKYGQISINGQKPISMSNIKYGQSFTDFQQQLSRYSNSIQNKVIQKYQRKRTVTQAYDPYEESYTNTIKNNKYKNTKLGKLHPLEIKNNSTVKQLQEELDQIKKMIQEQTRINTLQSKFDKMFLELEKKKIQKDNQYQQQQQMNRMMPQNLNNFYPNPFGYPYPPPYMNQPQKRSSRKHRQHQPSSEQDQPYPPKKHTSRTTKSIKPSSKPSTISFTEKLTYFFIKENILYCHIYFFLKKQAKTLSLARKNNLRKFWLEKFDTQIVNVKNWLLQGLKYTISIVLQKKQLNFNFFNQKRQKVKRQKQKLVLKLLYLTVEQLKKITTPKQTALFSQILAIVCRNGSFPMSRFWTVLQMQKIRISQYYGFIRAEQQTQKYLICTFIFLKMLIFNMLLQPFKFDSANFKKTLNLYYQTCTQSLVYYTTQQKNFYNNTCPYPTVTKFTPQATGFQQKSNSSHNVVNHQNLTHRVYNTMSTFLG